MEQKKQIWWPIAGSSIAIIAGSMLHFVFEWTGEWMPAALIAAVNESTWEHLKLAFWPMLVFALIAYLLMKGKVGHYWGPVAIGLFIAPAIITGLFYGYQWIIGGDSLAYDIGIFIVAVIVGFIASYKLMYANCCTRVKSIGAYVLLAMLIAAFSLFTYFPPKSFLFEDPITGGYGIIDNHGN